MYLVIEIQQSKEGAVSHLVTQHETQEAAEQKFHQVLAYAAVSNVAYHSAVILNGKGEWIKGETYRHAE